MSKLPHDDERGAGLCGCRADSVDKALLCGRQREVDPVPALGLDLRPAADAEHHHLGLERSADRIGEHGGVCGRLVRALKTEILGHTIGVQAQISIY